MENEILTAKEVLSAITEKLESASGEDIANIANQLELSNIKYVGDSLFEVQN